MRYQTDTIVTGSRSAISRVCCSAAIRLTGRRDPCSMGAQVQKMQDMQSGDRSHDPSHQATVRNARPRRPSLLSATQFIPLTPTTSSLPPSPMLSFSEFPPHTPLPRVSLLDCGRGLSEIAWRKTRSKGRVYTDTKAQLISASVFEAAAPRVLHSESFVTVNGFDFGK